MVIGGLDLSANHYAFVLKDLLTKRQKISFGWHSKSAIEKWKQKLPSEYFIYSLSNKKEDETREQHIIEAGNKLVFCIWNDLLTFCCNDLSSVNNIFTYNKYDNVIIALEGYAFSGSTVVSLAEVTSRIKSMLYNDNISIRIHDPYSVKSWAGVGFKKEQKIGMIEKARKFINIPDILTKTKNNPGFDIADAYFLMNMLETELGVRMNPLKLKQLDEGKLKVFNRCTKANPVNLLNRPFLSKEQPILTKSMKMRKIKK